MNTYVRLRREGLFGVITLDHAPVNAIRPGMPEAILAALEEAEREDTVQAIVMHGAGKHFAAGADIHAIQAAGSGAEVAGWLLPVLLRIEDCGKPVVMALHGSVLGGGLELAMAGHYRVATKDARLGMPEVNLGLIPGWGGTQRLPRLIGFEKALRLCRTGATVRAEQALRDGLVDRIIEGDLLAGAMSFAEGVLARGGALPKTRELTDQLDYLSPLTFANARAEAMRERRGERAPVMVIHAIEAAAKMPFAAGCRRETELFAARLGSGESRAMIHLFFSEREMAKGPTAAVEEIRQVGVVGDAELAEVLQRGGFEVLLTGVAVVDPDLGVEVVPGLSGLGGAQAVMASEPSHLEELSRVTRADCLLIALSEAGMAARVQNPIRLVGHRYAGGLLEIIRGPETGEAAVATSFALARRMGRMAVLGPLGSRLYGRYLEEARAVVREGMASEAEVDAALDAFGMGVLPFGSGAGRRDAELFEAPVPEVVRRILSGVAEEGRRMVAEGVATREGDLDVAFTRGYGFPVYRGGPMWFARS